MAANGYLSEIKKGFLLAVGASVALGVIKIIADVTGVIPRGFVLAQAGTFNTLSPDSTSTEYHLK